eukprot:357062-Chlamydomonas_euryale.AAC.3
MVQGCSASYQKAAKHPFHTACITTSGWQRWLALSVGIAMPGVPVGLCLPPSALFDPCRSPAPLSSRQLARV